MLTPHRAAFPRPLFKRVPLEDIRTAAAPVQGIIDRLLPLPVGARDLRIVSIRENFINQAYDVTYHYKYPMGQLSFGF